MTTSQTGFLSEILDGGKISKAKLAYFQERLRNRIHQFILKEFISKQKNGLTQADIARRLGRRPEQIHRWLGSPGNWTLDTVSDLMIAIAEAEIEFSAMSLGQRPARNFEAPNWIKSEHLAGVSGRRSSKSLPRSRRASPIAGGKDAAPITDEKNLLLAIG